MTGWEEDLLHLAEMIEAAPSKLSVSMSCWGLLQNDSLCPSKGQSLKDSQGKVEMALPHFSMN